MEDKDIFRLINQRIQDRIDVMDKERRNLIALKDWIDSLIGACK